MAEIVFDKASKHYPGGVHAVCSLDLAVDDGEFIVLVGPSGCGKSTALRMAAGLEDITDGRILIGGKVANDLSPRDRNIAMVFQSYALYPHLTAAENIGFGLRVRGVPRETIAAKVRAAAAILELSDYLDRKPDQLSGGQRQRVAMGRAIVREPAAFLMDEPLSNLDARLRVQMRAEIARIQKMAGVTTIYVTHDQVEAMTMGERVAVLNRGVLQQLGSPRTIYDRPANLFVASFIGSPAMNMLEGLLAEIDARPVIMIGEHLIALPPGLLARVPSLLRHMGRTLVIGLRPEAVHCGTRGDMHPSLNGTVAFTEDLGATILVHLDIDAPPPRLDAGRVGIAEAQFEIPLDVGTARVRTSVDGRVSIRPGDCVPIRFDLDRLHLFDPMTGVALIA